MAEEGTLCNNQDVKDECGIFANSTFTAEAYTNRYIKKAEGFLCYVSGYDWKTNYANVSTIGKELLREFVSSWSAIKVIKQDMSGNTSRQEALIMINYLWAVCDRILKDIDKNSYKKYVLSADGTI